ncbi:MAG TPA: shikimate kinase, partial [Candidatus Nitrosocosmicus sp.]|nr:shikimate kinase [Candidatus Nitrosocosmicus sp.]
MKKLTSTATVFGAISIINAIATGKGSTLGISLRVTAKITLEPGFSGISKSFANDRLINKIIRSIVPSRILNNHFVSISLTSDIPAGWGLKSSSAVSNAVSLACYKLMNDEIYDRAVLNTAVDSSLWAKVSITGAFDDACACYFGGIILSDNYYKKIIKRESINKDLWVMIFLPHGVSRGNVMRLKLHKDLFNHAFKIALKGDYWKAMNMNGLLINSILYNNYDPLLNALENNCLAVSYSGNGPAIAAVIHKDNVDNLKNSFDNLNGRLIVSQVNNDKSFV